MLTFVVAPLTRRLHLSLGGWMVLASVLAMLPLVVFTAATVRELVQGHQAEGRERLQRRTELAAGAIGRELAGAISLLEALGITDAAQREDFPRLHAEASRLVAANAGTGHVELLRPDGSAVFSTLRPFDGAPPARPQPLPPDRALLGAGRPAVSGLLRSQPGAEPAAIVQVPLHRGIALHYVLQMSVRSSTLAAVVRQQQWPPDWLAVVVDEQMTIVARSRDAERSVGTPATPSLQAALRGAAGGLFESDTREGLRMLTATARVPGTGWTVAVGMPLAGLQAQARQAVLGVLSGGLLCTVLGALLAAGLARALGRQARRTVDALVTNDASRLRRRVPVRELAEVSAAFRRVHTHLSASASALTDARHDPLTGLPGRGLFFERAEALLAAAAGTGPPRRCALLYVDLDGFKQLNDRDGHAAGDAALRRAAAALREQLRASDLIGRIGGDEFVAVFVAPAASVDELAPAIARRMVAGVEAQGLGCSIGIALTTPGEALPALLARADRAMYEAKRAGGRRVVREPAAAP